MKKFLGILFIVCLILPFIGTYTIYFHQKNIIRKSVKKQLLSHTPKDELVMLSFSLKESEELNWKHSKEFEYKGEMYDIVESKTEGDSVTYWCWWDHEETRLNRHLIDLVAKAMGADDANNTNQKNFSGFLKTLFCSELQDLYIGSDQYTLLSFNYKEKFSLNYLNDPPVPPPNFIF
ncbi:MAG: hypothetical protein A2W91_11150 [Bacteroidetes bacterium GWF2_38_335]|nr:MAG: hypothetical protein A2W91_11150 [Bacteroidetes bacterium GWF2_38_335]OFY81745.1 MAG: hypothetical protein A2281_05890 [Bacteroidetes bacterium RIFOXYA12_FULL_38_20]HBS87811.1 hypothetical protein [Bacteroidales bacterium]